MISANGESNNSFLGYVIAGIGISTVVTTVIAFVFRLLLITNLAASSSVIALGSSIIASAPLWFALVSGPIADTYHPRYVQALSLLLGALSMAFVAFAMLNDSLTAWMIILGGFLVSSFGIFFDSSIAATMPKVFSLSKLPLFNSLHEVILSVGALVSPWLGAVLFKLYNAPYLLIASAICMLFGAVFFFRVMSRVPAMSDESRQKFGLFEGLAFLLKDTALRAVTFSAAIFNVFHGMFFSLFSVFAIRYMNISITTLGGLFSISALVGGLWGIAVSKVIRYLGLYQSALLSMALILPGAFPLAIAIIFNFHPAKMITLTFCLWEMAVITNIVSESTIRQLVSPENRIGSVISAGRFISWGAEPIGAGMGALLAVIFPLIPILSMAMVGMGIAFLPLLSAKRLITDTQLLVSGNRHNSEHHGQRSTHMVE